MYPVADSIGSLFVIHSYLRTSCNLHKSRRCCALLKAETTLHPRRHRKAFSCEYLSFFNGSTILICAGREQERKKELTGINHYLKKCLTRYWQVTLSSEISCLCAVRTQPLSLAIQHLFQSKRMFCDRSIQLPFLSVQGLKYPAALCSAAAGVILLSFVAMKVNFCRIGPYLSKAVYRIVLNWHPWLLLWAWPCGVQ